MREYAKKKLIELKDSPRLELIRYIQDEDKRLTEFFGTNSPIYLDSENKDDAYVNIDQSFIALGEGFLEDHANKKMVRVAGLLAHEQSHLFQVRWTIDALLKEVRNFPVKFVELHADYLAGAYVGWRKKANPATPIQALEELFFELGDRNVRNRDHHGTPEERKLAFFQGYDDFPRLRGASGPGPAMVASHRGLMYVKAILL